MSPARYAQITGWGMAVPDKVLTNAELASVVDTTDEWIVSRTGISQRHVVASEKDTTASLGIRAARRALTVAMIHPGQVDLVIVATATPEYAFPATASIIQDAIGASRAGAFDLSAGCSGFVYALSVAANAIRAGTSEQVLVIGSETLSRVTDWTDRNTCILFGDGAGAVLLSACDSRCGVLATELGSDGSGASVLVIPAGGSRMPTSHETVSRGDHFIKMNGREVFRFATTTVPRAVERVAASAGWPLEEISLVVPHQANTRIIESASKRLKMPLERFFVNLDRYGNTSSASIPIALCEAIAQGRVNAGDKLILVGFGAGLTWGATALEWGLPVPMAPVKWPRRWIGQLLYPLAKLRSLGLRAVRSAYNWILGPINRDDWRGSLRQSIDELRGRLGRRK